MKAPLFLLLLPTLTLAGRAGPSPTPQLVPAKEEPPAPDILLRMIHSENNKTYFESPCASEHPVVCSEQLCKMHTAADPDYNCETLFKDYLKLNIGYTHSLPPLLRTGVVAKIRLNHCEPWKEHPSPLCSAQLYKVVMARWPTENLDPIGLEIKQPQGPQQPRWKRDWVESPRKLVRPPKKVESADEVESAGEVEAAGGVESSDKGEMDPAPPNRSWLAQINTKIEKQHAFVTKKRTQLKKHASPKGLRKLKAWEKKLTSLERLRDKKMKVENKKAAIKIKWAKRKLATKAKWADRKEATQKKWTAKKAAIKAKWAERKHKKRKEAAAKNPRKPTEKLNSPEPEDKTDVDDEFDEEELDIDQQLEEVEADEEEVAEDELAEEEAAKEEAAEKPKKGSRKTIKPKPKPKTKPAAVDTAEEAEEEIPAKPSKKGRKKTTKPKPKTEPADVDTAEEAEEAEEEVPAKPAKKADKKTKPKSKSADVDNTEKVEEVGDDTSQETDADESEDSADETEVIVTFVRKPGGKTKVRTANKKGSKEKRDVSQKPPVVGAPFFSMAKTDSDKTAKPTATPVSSKIDRLVRPNTGNTKPANTTRPPILRPDVVDQPVKPKTGNAKPAKPTRPPVHPHWVIGQQVKPKIGNTKRAKPTSTHIPDHREVDRLVKPEFGNNDLRPAKPTGPPVLPYQVVDQLVKPETEYTKPVTPTETPFPGEIDWLMKPETSKPATTTTHIG